MEPWTTWARFIINAFTTQKRAKETVSMEKFNISCTIFFMVKNFVHLHILVKDSSTDWSVEKKNLVKISVRASNYFILSVTYWVLNHPVDPFGQGFKQPSTP